MTRLPPILWELETLTWCFSLSAFVAACAVALIILTAAILADVCSTRR